MGIDTLEACCGHGSEMMTEVCAKNPSANIYFNRDIAALTGSAIWSSDTNYCFANIPPMAVAFPHLHRPTPALQDPSEVLDMLGLPGDEEATKPAALPTSPTTQAPSPDAAMAQPPFATPHPYPPMTPVAGAKRPFPDPSHP